MDISAGLIAKGALGAGALAAAGGTSYVYRDEIGDFISPLWTKEHEKINKKLAALKIEEAGCKFAENDSSKECELDETKLKKINFSIKESDAEATVSGLDSSKNISLKIEKVSVGNEFPGNLKFTLTSKATDSVEIKKTGNDNNKITLKKDSDYEFKLSSDGNKLEKAWTLKTLGEKLNLFTCGDSNINGSTGECTLKEEINVWKSDSEYITGGKTTSGGTGQKITFTGDSPGYFEGLKFTVTADVALSEGTKKKTSGDGITKLSSTGNNGYELGIKNTDNGEKWFFIEKAAS